MLTILRTRCTNFVECLASVTNLCRNRLFFGPWIKTSNGKFKIRQLFCIASTHFISETDKNEWNSIQQQPQSSSNYLCLLLCSRKYILRHNRIQCNRKVHTNHDISYCRQFRSRLHSANWLGNGQTSTRQSTHVELTDLLKSFLQTEMRQRFFSRFNFSFLYTLTQCLSQTHSGRGHMEHKHKQNAENFNVSMKWIAVAVWCCAFSFSVCFHFGRCKHKVCLGESSIVPSTHNMRTWTWAHFYFHNSFVRHFIVTSFIHVTVRMLPCELWKKIE